MDPARRKRKEDIKKALIFIQSSLAYPEPEDYQDFLIRLVCNLLEEGNDLFRDQEWDRAVREYSEGLNVSSYAAGEEIHIPEVLLESLYVNRAAAYHSMGEYERGVKDCDRALDMCKESRRALYRKGLCLKELGKYKEAYNCTTDCLLISRLDKQVNELAQELAVHLGLKIRKPYVAAKDDTLIRKDVAKGIMTAEATKVSGVHVGNGLNPLSSLEPVTFPKTTQSIVTSTLSSCSQPTVPVADREDTLDDLELMGDDLDSLLDCFPTEQKPAEIQTQAAFSVSSRMSPPTVPSVLPAPTPQLPPAFFSSSVSQLNSLDSFSSSRHSTTTLDTLDNLLSQQRLDALDNISGSGGNAGTPNSRLTPVVMDALDGLDTLDDLLDSAVNAASSEKVNESKTESDTREKSLDDLLDELDPLETLSDSDGHITDGLKLGVKVMDQLDSLDTLDSFLSVETVGAASTAAFAGGTDLNSLSRFRADGISGSHIAAAPVTRSRKKERNNQALAVASNPLSSTHEFLQACSACFPREGRGIYTYVHKPDLVHNCKRDILLCRQKADDPSNWTRVRQLPATTSFKGPFVLCKELIKSGDLGLCKYGEKCTFAYNQLEIDVWTEERKGTLNRNLLFKTDPESCIISLLQEHKGTFMFLCQECFNSKPRIFSKRCRENLTICSNLDARHTFDANKGLAFQVRAHNVIYNKVRPLGVMCQLDFCRKYIGYSYCREDNCAFAHSCIELKTWRVQQHTGISHDEIVKISTKYYDKLDQNFSKQKGNKLSYEGGGGKPKEGGGVGGAGKSLNMKMKFACAHCWRDGNIVEPDKTLKYCTAKARHPWTKDRRVLLVRSIERSKWIQVRPLPQSKFPVEFEVCTQMLRRRKCDYSGNCTFAHSQEEKDMWMYMKNNDLRDMQQIYNMWLTLSTQTPQTDGAAVTQPVPEDKYIVMPTDYAEPMSDFYCRLCGKNSNSERQWQQHISTEKHKDRVFSYEEEEALMWSCRFPGRCFEICPKLDAGCADGVSCDYAHSPKELQEWTERRDFLRQKLAKAREDMLVMPDEVDFGKYNFLLQD